MRFIPAPDFPTGGVLARDDELLEAYRTGRGRLKLRAKVEIEPAANGKTLLVIREVPYQVNKSAMLERYCASAKRKSRCFPASTIFATNPTARACAR